LCGELDYEIQDDDNIHFISTLHGGWNTSIENLCEHNPIP
jgi:hypothetical protein